MACLGAGVQLLCVCWGLECKSGALLVEVIGTGVALGIGVDAALISHFLRKLQFLSVILSDPSTLIQQHCHCPRNLGGLYFHLLSSLRFLLRVLTSHWIGDM